MAPTQWPAMFQFDDYAKKKLFQGYRVLHGRYWVLMGWQCTVCLHTGGRMREREEGRQPAGDGLHMTAATSVLHCTTDMSRKHSPSRMREKSSTLLLFFHDFSRTSRLHTIILRPMHRIPPASPYRAACIAYASAPSASSCSAMLCLANYECV